LLSALLQKEWLAGKLLPAQDLAERNRLAPTQNRIGYLVVCRGVPLRIKNDNSLVKRENIPDLPPGFTLSVAAVDSELALLAYPDSSATGIVPNPLYSKETFVQKIPKDLLPVSRIDGPALADCLRLVDDTLFAEKEGLAGRAYVDIGGPFPQGDTWFRVIADLLRGSGFDITQDNSPALLDHLTRSDAPAFYFGWYSEKIAGRFGDPDLHFVPGAIAMHLHSFSASTLRSTKRGWVAPLVSRGAAVSLGNVAEPYLSFSTNPALFTALLLEGKQVGEAYFRASPAWSWQCILIGDPLYSPFKVSLKEQMARLKKGDPEKYNPARHDYILLRHANLLIAAGKKDEAVSELASAIRKHPSLPLRFALARAANHPALAWSADDADGDTDTGLLVEIARYLQKNASPSNALHIYKFIFQHSNPPPALRKKLLPEAIETATAAGEISTAQHWREEE
jgi:uncharacterized protein (TIGR03790 family)